MAKQNSLKLDRTVQQAFSIGPENGSNTVMLKTVAGAVVVRTFDDSADQAITASLVNVSGNSINLNSDAASTGADWELTLSRPATGMTAAIELVFPAALPSIGQVLSVVSVTGSVVVLGWISAGSTAQCSTVYEIDVNYTDTSPITLGTVPANFDISEVRIVVETAFTDVTSVATIGITGTTSKYMAANDSYLAADPKSVAVNWPGETPSGSAETIIVTFTAGTSTAGKIRCYVTGAVPL